WLRLTSIATGPGCERLDTSRECASILRRGQEVMTVQHRRPDQNIRPNQAVDLDTVLRRYVADPTASWGLGTFGAVAEFHRTAEEPASIDTGATLQVVTERGALRIDSTQEVRAFAYELPGHAGDSW